MSIGSITSMMCRHNGRGAEWILNNKIQKIDTDTNRVLVEWSSLEHVDLPGTCWRASEPKRPIGLLSGQHAAPAERKRVHHWGYEGAMSEHTPDRTTIVHTYLDSGKLAPGTENYRAFKFEWHARPYEEPVLVAFKENDGTALYVEPFGSE